MAFEKRTARACDPADSFRPVLRRYLLRLSILILACLLEAGPVACWAQNADVQATPLVRQHVRITVYASGGADFAPSKASKRRSATESPLANETQSAGAALNLQTGGVFVTVNPANSAPVQSPEEPPACPPEYTEVGLRVVCDSDPTSSSADVCRGSINFYGLNVSETVEGSIKSDSDGSFAITLHSSDQAIDGCMITIGPQPTSEAANTIKMPSCHVSLKGCTGEVAGSAANRSLTNSGSVTVEPAD
jgi:hypothetical protein